MSERLWSDILVHHKGKQYSTKFKSKKIEGNMMIVTMELILEEGLKCVAKCPTWFGLPCGEPVTKDLNGRLKHKFSHLRTYDHEPKLE